MDVIDTTFIFFNISELTNLVGQPFMSQSINVENNVDCITFSVSDLPQGIYFCALTKDNNA
jgi:hypothetical protein